MDLETLKSIPILIKLENAVVFHTVKGFGVLWKKNKIKSQKLDR